MNSSRAAVENKPTLVFAERVFSDRLAKKAATIAKIQRTTSTKNSAPNTDVTSPMVMFEVMESYRVMMKLLTSCHSTLDKSSEANL